VVTIIHTTITLTEWLGRHGVIDLKARALIFELKHKVVMADHSASGVLPIFSMTEVITEVDLVLVFERYDCNRDTIGNVHFWKLVAEFKHVFTKLVQFPSGSVEINI
jgi:hypothetical protein